MSQNTRHRDLGLTDEQVLDMYKYMVLARKVDERLWLLNRSGKIPFVISCQGQEGAQAGAGFALDHERDYVAPYYRDLCLVLTWGHTAQTELLAAFGKAEDPNSGGRQMPGHYGDRKRRILTGSSPVSTQIPHAVGLALASRMRGENAVAYVSFGEGSSNQGDFHEAANFAGVHRLPVIFFCENNRYAISVPQGKQIGSANVADRAVGYGFEGVVVDGMDPLEVYRVVKEAADKARTGGGPTLIEAQTYRLVPHSSDDDDRAYRSREEVEDARRGDSLVRMKAYLLEAGLMTEEDDKKLQTQLQEQVNEATRYAESAPSADPATLMDHLYGEEATDHAR